MAICQKGSLTGAPEIGGYPILAGPVDVKINGQCFDEYDICTDTGACVVKYNYNTPVGCTPRPINHWYSKYRVAKPCPPPGTGPPDVNQPRTVQRCKDRDMYSFVVDTSGREGVGSLVQANHPDCIKPETVNLTCQVYPGTAPADDGGGPWSIVPEVISTAGGLGWEYASGTGQAGSFPCWRRRPNSNRPHPAGPDFHDLLASVLFPNGTEYVYSIWRSGISTLNPPYAFDERSTAKWAHDPLTSTNGPESSGLCIPVTFGPTQGSTEVTANFTISQKIIGDTFTVAKLWALNYYYECLSQKASQLPFLKSYFPLYVDNAVSSKQNSPSEYLTTWILPGGVEVIIPTFLFAKGQNTFYMNTPQSKSTLPQTYQDCGSGTTLTQGWDYATKVWSTFSASIRVPRCIVQEGGTLDYHIDITFSLPEALSNLGAGASWSVIQDRAGVDLCINTPGCVKKNHQIMVYEKSNDYSVFEGLPVSPPMPAAPTAPIAPTDPLILFIENESESLTYESPPGSGNFVTQVTYNTYISRPGYPNTYYVTPNTYEQQALIDAGIPLPSPLIFLWRKSPPSPVLSPPLDFIQEPGYPDPKPIYLAQQSSLMAYYNECVALKAAYTMQKGVYDADLADYNDSLTYYNNHTLPDWKAADQAARDAYIAAAKSIGVGVGQTPQENTKGGIHLP